MMIQVVIATDRNLDFKDYMITNNKYFVTVRTFFAEIDGSIMRDWKVIGFVYSIHECDATFVKLAFS